MQANVDFHTKLLENWKTNKLRFDPMIIKKTAIEQCGKPNFKKVDFQTNCKKINIRLLKYRISVIVFLLHNFMSLSVLYYIQAGEPGVARGIFFLSNIEKKMFEFFLPKPPPPGRP